MLGKLRPHHFGGKMRMFRKKYDEKRFVDDESLPSSSYFYHDC